MSPLIDGGPEAALFDSCNDPDHLLFLILLLASPWRCRWLINCSDVGIFSCMLPASDDIAHIYQADQVHEDVTSPSKPSCCLVRIVSSTHRKTAAADCSALRRAVVD